MKVYYDSSLWSARKGFSGFPQRVNWQFEHGGVKRFIPVIYRFSKGVVFDVITIIDDIRVNEYFEKYKDIENQLTSIQRRCAEQEHPYQVVPIKEILINGKQSENYSSSGTVSIPWLQKSDDLMHLRKAYSSILRDSACFACERFCVPYSKTNSIAQILMDFFRLNSVKSVKLSTYPVQKFFPLDIHFQMLAEEKQKEISFKHPATGITHTLYYQDVEFMEMPLGEDGNRRFYVTQSLYEISPELPHGDTLQFNSSIQYSETLDDSYSPTAASSIGIIGADGPTAASSIGIIGGADGPTAIFVSAKDKETMIPIGKHELPLHSCFSIPKLYKENTSNFVLEGINIKDCDSEEYNFIYT